VTKVPRFAVSDYPVVTIRALSLTKVVVFHVSVIDSFMIY
jgi:hypothetical protein